MSTYIAHPIGSPDPSEYIASLTDAELKASAAIANVDLERAAASERDSAWHQACFAAVFMFAKELARRGIDPRA